MNLDSETQPTQRPLKVAGHWVLFFWYLKSGKHGGIQRRETLCTTTFESEINWLRLNAAISHPYVSPVSCMVSFQLNRVVGKETCEHSAANAQTRVKLPTPRRYSLSRCHTRNFAHRTRSCPTCQKKSTILRSLNF